LLLTGHHHHHLAPHRPNVLHELCSSGPLRVRAISVSARRRSAAGVCLRHLAGTDRLPENLTADISIHSFLARAVDLHRTALLELGRAEDGRSDRDRGGRDTLLSCTADLFAQVSQNKKRLGVITPSRFFNRLRQDNGVCHPLAQRSATPRECCPHTTLPHHSSCTHSQCTHHLRHGARQPCAWLSSGTCRAFIAGDHQCSSSSRWQP
jgi:hypothetical protein